MEQFPETVKRFVAEKLDTVCQLELVLALFRAPEKLWTVEAVSRELYIAPESAAAELQRLTNRGLLAVDPSPVAHYRFNVSQTDLAPTVSQLAELYRDYRVALIALIYSQPTDKLRAFADAFRLRREE